MEMEKMIELIDAVSKSDLTGFKYEEEGIKLHLSKKENTCYVTENLSAPVNAVTTSAAEIKKSSRRRSDIGNVCRRNTCRECGGIPVGRNILCGTCGRCGKFRKSR